MRQTVISPRICIAFLFAAIFLTGCTSRPTAVSKTPEITVAAAANLTDAFDELARQFTAETGIKVIYNFGSTAELARQVENGAPFDAIAAADVDHIDSLDKKGLLVPGSRMLYARGRLVLWIPASSKVSISRLEEISRPEINRIAIAKPDVAPYGRATLEALKSLGLWSAIEPKVVYGQNVSQTRQFASTGNAEAAFIPMSLVKTGEGHYIEVPQDLYQPIEQALGIVRASPNQESARTFVNYVTGEKGQVLLSKYGYLRP
jgi:molybdate transport system substrate-binding protein